MSTKPVQAYGPCPVPPAIVTGPVGPQTSTSSTVVVAGSEMDVTQFPVLSYTAVVASHDIDWSVFGANTADYSDEVAVLTATKIATGATSSYSTTNAPYRFYRVKVIDDVGGVHGTLLISGVAKTY
jgi:hypothetical protein